MEEFEMKKVIKYVRGLKGNRKEPEKKIENFENKTDQFGAQGRRERDDYKVK